MRSTSCGFRALPRMRWTPARFSTIGAWSRPPTTTSSNSPVSVPPPEAIMSSATRFVDRIVDSKSAPRSKRWEASVCKPCRLETLRMVAGSHQADSIRMLRVFSVIMVSNPPITPASPTGFLASQTTRSSTLSLRSTPSRVRSVSPGRAKRTMIMPPSSRSRSKTWVGLPISQRT